jgi:hypothetical protein
LGARWHVEGNAARLPVAVAGNKPHAQEPRNILGRRDDRNARGQRPIVGAAYDGLTLSKSLAEYALGCWQVGREPLPRAPLVLTSIRQVGRSGQ